MATLFKDAPITYYPNTDNRLLVIDWASLSYHQFHSLGSAKNKEKYGLLDAEGEIQLWRTMMVTRLIDYISLFNPRHIIFALEGKDAWRRGVVKEYYNTHSDVYWNKTEYYIQSDNDVFMVQQAGDGFAVTKFGPDTLKDLAELKHKKLCDMPEKQRRMFWDVYTAGGDPILPSYKGTRKKKPWTFAIDKKVWAEYRERFAFELAPLFRAKAVQCMRAEGDDVIYASVKKYAGEMDDVIVITRDSDMCQIDVPGVKLFNHMTGNFMKEDDPAKYLDGKVLSGDTSDNVHGMAFVDQKTGKFKADKKTRISEAGARTLLESCPNIYSTAKDEGWVDQYVRNRTLIDLSRVPKDVSAEIDMALDVPEPELGGFERLEFWCVPDMIRRSYLSLQNAGFYAVNPVVGAIPFNRAMFAPPPPPKEEVDIRPDDVITAANIGNLGGIEDIDVIF